MKKRTKEILFILIVSLLACLPFIIKGVSSRQDAYFHIARLTGIKEAWLDGQIIPRIYPEYNNNYGYGNPLFYCDIYLWPFALLYVMGVPLIVSYKIMLCFYVTLSVIIIYIVAKKIFKKDSTVYITTLLFTFSNYHLMDIHFRGALGEILVITFIPLVYLAMYKLFIKNEDAWILLGVCFSLLVFGHNLTFALYCVLFGVLLIIYLILNIKNKEVIINTLKTTLKGVILAICLSAWYLIPMLEQMLNQTFNYQTYTIYYHINDSSNTTTLLNILNIKNFLIYWTPTKDSGIGISLTLIPILYIFIKKSKYINVLLVVCLFCWLCMFGIIPLEKIEIVNTMQFMFRLYVLLFPIHTFICAYIFDNTNKESINKICLILVSIMSCISMISCIDSFYDEYIDDNTTEEEIYSEELFKSTGYNDRQLMAKEYLPVSLELDYENTLRNIKLQYGEYSFEDVIMYYDYTEKGSQILFESNFEEDVTLVLPKTYYKGYQAFLTEDDTWTKIDTHVVDNYGLVGIEVPSGTHAILCKYSGTKIQKLSTLLSGTTLVVIVIYLYIKNRRANKNLDH